MSSIISLLGMAAAYAFIFIVLLAIVEYIPVLKLIPAWKYGAPFILGTIAVGFSASSISGWLPWLVAIIAIGLAGRYSYEGMEKGYEILRAAEHKPVEPAAN